MVHLSLLIAQVTVMYARAYLAGGSADTILFLRDISGSLTRQALRLGYFRI